ncbi:MAG TPA: hydrogenase expression/formation protein HypE [Longimicrobium sp.]|nr:hydrogenase expression/formation protein HypE [Longimicrobium sp.]
MGSLLETMRETPVGEFASEAAVAAAAAIEVPAEIPATEAPNPALGACPLPMDDYPTVVMAHGGGGRMSKLLTEQLFFPALGNPLLAAFHDGSVLEIGGARLAVSTDSFVISPAFFPGGDIGSLAVHGTVNDLAMCGARPLALSAGFILEEGFPMADLWRAATSMRAAADAAGVQIVTGDTKVVDRGKGDGIYINTTGIGIVPAGVEIAPTRARPGDVVLLSGSIATHGIAILSVREGLEFDTELRSDSAALNGMVSTLVDRLGRSVHVLRDPTRGGVASALNEIASSAGVGISLDEARIPVLEEVRGACEILGLDPLYVANEGKLIAIVSREVADEALAILRAHPLGTEAAIVGEVVEDHPGRVFLRSRIGGRRVVEMLSGEQLPRIC